jgi:hypothetical protein
LEWVRGGGGVSRTAQTVAILAGVAVALFLAFAIHERTFAVPGLGEREN